MDKEKKVIYLWTNLVNGKQYVGQTNDIERRIHSFKYSKIYANEYIDSDRKRYNYSNWKFDILRECDIEESDYWEKYYIKELNTKYPNGYNITDGGIGLYGYQHTDETKKKISESTSIRQIREKNHFFGKHHSNETKKKMSEALAKPVIQVFADGSKKEYYSATDAADKNKLSNSSLSYACNGKYGKQGHYYKGSFWFYKT